jgi:hypothetical protein
MWRAGTALAIVTALAGAGGCITESRTITDLPDSGLCGRINEACCPSAQCATPDTICKNNICVVSPEPCGKIGQPCCGTNSCFDLHSTCGVGTCVECGGLGQLCCNEKCLNPLHQCQSNVCAWPPTGNTGATCASDKDCTGSRCLLVDTKGTTWPDGYCSATCNPMMNDKYGLNADCPGGKAVCIGNQFVGQCENRCTAMTGPIPCTRTGYACFEGCEPISQSMCDPAQVGACGNAKSCFPIGQDPVGGCFPACDPFLQQGCAMDEGCIPSTVNGESICFPAYYGHDGDECDYFAGCSPGLGCQFILLSGTCRPFCGGPGNVSCPDQRTCVPYSDTVPSTVIGLCAG